MHYVLGVDNHVGAKLYDCYNHSMVLVLVCEPPEPASGSYQPKNSKNRHF